MSDKTFRIVLISLLAVCFVATAVMIFYTAHLHDTCSIIAYIANER